MKDIPLLALVYSPGVAREFALGQSDLAAIMVNSLSGSLVIASMAITAPWPLTPALILSLAILYGPLLGFTTSSLYTGIETIIGGRLGGQASFSACYRLLAWSFIPLAFAFFICILIEERSGLPTSWIDPLQTIILIVFALIFLRNYYTNLRVIQQLTRVKSVASLLISFTLFMVLVVIGLKYLIQFFLYGTNLGLM